MPSPRFLPSKMAPLALALSAWFFPFIAQCAEPVASVDVASFDTDTDGFSTLVRDEKEPKVGRAAGRIDNPDKRFVLASKTLPASDRDWTAVTLWARSTDTRTLTIRLVDSTKQTFLRRLPMKNDGNWQRIELTDFEKAREIYGGAGDKLWHGPPLRLEFVLEAKGSLWIDDVKAVLGAPAQSPGPAAVPTATTNRSPRTTGPVVAAAPAAPLGNVFIAGQRVSLSLESLGESIDWKVTDFAQKLVAAGTTAVTGGRAAITPDVNEIGYYLLRGTPKGGGRTFEERMTSFAVVRAHPVTDPLGSPFGVVSHFAQGMNPEILPTLKQVGIAAVRDEHYWAQVEKATGAYVFPAKSDQWMAACKVNGIQPLIPMTFGNPLYDEGNNPYTPSGRLAYARYGQAILDHYGEQARWLEVWNEYNGTWLKGPAKEQPAKAYAEMVKVAYAQVKQKRPDVQVIGCAPVLIPLPYFEGIFEAGGLQSMDAVAIHPYRPRPEGVEREVAELQQLIRKYNRGKDKPIWATEAGHFDNGEYEWEAGRKSFELGRANVARYLARQYTLLLSQGVSKVFWYLAADHQDRVTMGLLRNRDDHAAGGYAVTPVYVAYANLIHQLDGAKFVRRVATVEYSRARLYLFEKPGAAPVHVCWATRPAVVRFKTNTPLTVVDLMGAERQVAPSDGSVVLPLTDDAVYVHGAVKAVEEIPGAERVLADSLDDYSKTQGQNGWYYGYYDGSGKGKGNGLPPKGPYTDDDFHTLSLKQTAWGYTFGGAGPLSVSGEAMHPGSAQGADVWAVTRWVSGVAGPARVKGSFRASSSKGDGVLVQVMLDGQVVYTQPVGGKAAKRAEVDVPITLRRGSLIDVCVRPNESPEFDATGYEVRIVQPR